MKSKKRIVLAYSGGLDTSIILKWLQENYDAEVICYTADVGQEIDRKKIIKNAKRLGVKNIIIEDLKDTFVKDYVFPMIRGHAIYEGVYLLGTSIARPLIAKRQIAAAKKFGAYAVSHGSTGKGNDQVRFELGYHYFGPKVKIIAPWRIWKLNSRTDLIKYAKKNNIPIPTDKKGAPPFSIDDNLYHTSTEGKVLENPKNSAPEFLFQRTVSPEKAPNKASFVTIGFKNGDPITVNGKKLSPGNLLEKLNDVAGKNGIGRVDLVENRFIGIKSRGVYETPGGTLLMSAHRAIESVTLDKETMHKKDEIMPKYAELIYNGYWYSKARFKLQKIVDLKKNKVNGSVKLKLYKGNITIMSRQTKSNAYSMKKVSFEENKTFNKSNVERFINFHKQKSFVHKLMKIKVFADTICGWCFIGQTRLNKALKAFPETKFEIEHVPFQLNTDMPKEGIERSKYLEIKFGGKEFAQPMYDRMTEEANKEDLNFNLDKIKKTPNTVFSHLLIKLAEQSNVHNEIKEKIYQSYFIEGLDIGDKEILINIGKEFNINADVINDFFNLKNIEKVNSYISVAREKEINGVPFFEIGTDFISGAQSSTNLESAIKSNLS